MRHRQTLSLVSGDIATYIVQSGYFGVVFNVVIEYNPIIGKIRPLYMRANIAAIFDVLLSSY